jgi:hypothetical protein
MSQLQTIFKPVIHSIMTKQFKSPLKTKTPKFSLHLQGHLNCLNTYFYTSLKYLSVADNAGDAVLFHVSASSEGQE